MLNNIEMDVIDPVNCSIESITDLDPDDLKICTKCKRVLSKSYFTVHRRCPDGLSYICKDCAKKEARLSYDRIGKHTEPRKTKESIIFRIRRWSKSTISNHRKKGHKVDIKLDELVNFVTNKKNCAYCDGLLKWEYGNGGSANNSPTLDRINNAQIITINNVQILCRRCNTAKLDRSHDDFVRYCTLIRNKFDSIEYV